MDRIFRSVKRGERLPPDTLKSLLKLSEKIAEMDDDANLFVGEPPQFAIGNAAFSFKENIMLELQRCTRQYVLRAYRAGQHAGRKEWRKLIDDRNKR